jgi:hypothetical protein
MPRHEFADDAPERASRFLAFIDECGDHSWTHINPEFPLFVLSTIIVERDHYAREIIPALARLKLRYWPHEGVNLHTRDIRKALVDFAFLQVPALREPFLAEVSAMMARFEFTLFITGVRKSEFIAAHGAHNASPYEIALERTVECVLHFLEGQGETALPVIAEARGKAEDVALTASFFRLLHDGTRTVPGERFRRLHCPMSFVRKVQNIAGTQLADLCGYLSSRHILKPAQPNVAFDVVRPRLYQRDGETGWQVLP